METSLAGASASDNYIYKWECSYSFIKSFCLLLIFLCTQFILLCQVMGPAPETNINMSDALHFPKLNGSNYDSWAASMKSALQSQFLWLYVNGEEDMPTVVKSTPLHLIEHQQNTRVGKRTESSTKPGCEWIALPWGC